MKTSTLKPGVLVGLKTTLSGGVNYQRNDIEADHADGDGGRIAKWETTRQIENEQEYERATVARSAARIAITRVCHATSFGLLCPTEREPELLAAIAESRRIAQEFNAGAERTNIGVYVLVGRIASDDVEAARAINAEVRDMVEAMKAGIQLADPNIIRDAASKAKQISGMLSAEVAGKVGEAIAEARAAARILTAKVIKAGETAADVVKVLNTEKLDAARFAVLDLDPVIEVVPVELTGRAVDLMSERPLSAQDIQIMDDATMASYTREEVAMLDLDFTGGKAVQS